MRRRKQSCEDRQNIAFCWDGGTRCNEFPGGKTGVQEVPVQGPCFLGKVPVKLFSKDGERGRGSTLKTASRIWSGRRCRPNLLDSECAQQKGEDQESDMAPDHGGAELLTVCTQNP